MPASGFTLEGIAFPVAPDALEGFSIREIVYPVLFVPPFTTGEVESVWVATDGGTVWLAAAVEILSWVALPAPPTWVALPAPPTWVALPAPPTWVVVNSMGVLVQNTLSQPVPGSSTVRLGMDFGNLPEITAGGVIASCAITIQTVTAPASPALTVVAASTTIDNAYLVSALFTGGAVGDYLVTFTPTLVSGQVLPPRAGTLTLQ